MNMPLKIAYNQATWRISHLFNHGSQVASSRHTFFMCAAVRLKPNFEFQYFQALK